MGYDFNIGGIITTGASGLFHGATVNNLKYATLEVKNGATATQDANLSTRQPAHRQQHHHHQQRRHLHHQLRHHAHS